MRIGTMLFTVTLVLSLSQCIVTRVDTTSCTTNDECREAFGFGGRCVEGGFCSRAQRARCGRTFPLDLFEEPELYRDYFVVGAIFNFSSETHLARINSVQLAVSAVNDRLGIAEGRRVALVACDNAPDANGDGLTRDEASIQNAQWLADDLGATAIIGPSSSSAAEAVFGALGERDVVLVSPAATSPALTELEDPPTADTPGLLWRTAVPDTFQARAIVADLRSRGVSEIAVVHSAEAYGEGLANELRMLLTETGEGVTTYAFEPNDDAGRSDAIVRGGNDPASEVVFISTAAHASQFLASVEGLSTYDSKQLFLTDVAANTELFDSLLVAEPVYDRVRGTRPGSPSGSVFDLFVGDYQSEFDDDPSESRFSFLPHAWDAAFLVLYGAVWAAENEADLGGRSIARGIRQLNAGQAVGLAGFDWTSGIAELRAGRSIDVEGASGQLDYDLSTEETAGAIDVWGIDAAGPDPIVVTLVRYEPESLLAGR